MWSHVKTKIEATKNNIIERKSFYNLYLDIISYLNEIIYKKLGSGQSSISIEICNFFEMRPIIRSKNLEKLAENIDFENDKRILINIEATLKLVVTDITELYNQMKYILKKNKNERSNIEKFINSKNQLINEYKKKLPNNMNLTKAENALNLMNEFLNVKNGSYIISKSTIEDLYDTKVKLLSVVEKIESKCKTY